jgi:hypothetical protein
MDGIGGCAIGVLAVTALLLVGGAYGATPVAVERYSGRTSQREPIELQLSSNGGRLQSYRLYGQFSCDQPGFHGPYPWSVLPADYRGGHEPAVKVTAGGSFSVKLTLRGVLKPTHAGKSEKVSGAASFTGKLQLGARGQGTRARGTLDSHAQGTHGLRCSSGPVSWSAA